MATAIRRAKKFNNKKDDQDFDLALQTNYELQDQNYLEELRRSGMSEHEAHENYVECLRTDKLIRLMKKYKIPLGEASDMLFQLSMQLAQEFVHGFRVVPSRRKKMDNHHFYMKLFQIVARFVDNGKTINNACTSLVKTDPNFKKYEPKVLAALYRRRRNELNQINMLTGKSVHGAEHFTMSAQLWSLALRKRERTMARQS